MTYLEHILRGPGVTMKKMDQRIGNGWRSDIIDGEAAAAFHLDDAPSFEF